MELVALIISIFGVLVTIALGIYLYKLTEDSAKDMRDFLSMLIINASPFPETLKKLLTDVKNTGAWRGTVEKNPTGDGYYISWTPLSVSPVGKFILKK